MDIKTLGHPSRVRRVPSSSLIDSPLALCNNSPFMLLSLMKPTEGSSVSWLLDGEYATVTSVVLVDASEETAFMFASVR